MLYKSNQHLPDNDFLVLLLAAPPADAGQAEAVVAVLQDAKAPVTQLLLFQHHVQADAAGLLSAGRHRKGVLHVLLMDLHALLDTCCHGNNA